MADDVTAEADSGGHNRQSAGDRTPADDAAPWGPDGRSTAMTGPLWIARGGGSSFPWVAAGASAMEAAYLVTGSVNQACVEAGTSTPSARCSPRRDRRTLRWPQPPTCSRWGSRCAGPEAWHDVRRCGPASSSSIYSPCYDAIERIPAAERAMLEKELLRASGDDLGPDAEHFQRPATRRQIERALRDPKHKMALIFRWYLGQSSPGPARVNPRGPSITRSGAALRWPRSTTGSAARSWNGPKTESGDGGPGTSSMRAARPDPA